jgi:hypothetical protein
VRSSLEIDAASVGMDIARGPVLQKRVERTTAAPEDKVAEPWVTGPVDMDPVTAEVPAEAAVPEQAAA